MLKMTRGLFQLHLLAATMSCMPTTIASMSSFQSSSMTLTPAQQASLSELIHLTLDSESSAQPSSTSSSSSSSSSAHWRDKAERECINEIVREVDSRFTSVAPPSALSSMWSTDDGASDEVLATLSTALKKSVNSMEDIDLCTTTINTDCTNEQLTSSETASSHYSDSWTGWSRDKQLLIARQASNALLKACRKGSSAKFKVRKCK
jgi:hypothetical protein